MADVDYFKRINDHLGHAAGDAVLVHLARRLQSLLRPYDGVGRYGGEEFLLILPSCDRYVANSRIEKLRETIAVEPVILPKESINVTMSFGIFFSDGGDSPELQRVLRAADDALYKAKNSGRNCVCLAVPD
jgi:diguanylate cyclase (GGDEF)-like protein